jgi:L-threonylcarbamoyladenylate synthase
MSRITSDSGADFQDTIQNGEIAIFPTDTLYGIACDPDDNEAIERIHELKGRPPKKPAAVMYFSLERLLGDFGAQFDAPTRTLFEQLLPGPFTLVVANPDHRFAPSCAGTPDKLGLRVPLLPAATAPLGEVEIPVFQTSANLSGGPDAASFDQIDPAIRAGVDLEIDGGTLPGTASTVIDVSEIADGRWRVLRPGREFAVKELARLIGFPPSGG